MKKSNTINRTAAFIAMTAMGFSIVSANKAFAQAGEGAGENAKAKNTQESKQDDKKQDDVKRPSSIQEVGDGKIKFTFEQTPWEPVIQFFAKEAGFYLQPEAMMPEGSFRYSDSKEFTVLEGLDLLNRALALREYTLLRNEKMLYLIRVEQLRDAKFRDFVEWVKPEDLESRGLYEIMQVEFDLGDLDVDEIRRDVDPYIGDAHRRAFKLAIGAKKMIVRENGGALRKINALINSAQMRLDARLNKLTIIQLKKSTADDIMPIIRTFEKLDQNNESRNGDLSIVVDPLMNTLYVRGTESRVRSLKKSIETIEAQWNVNANDTLETPYLKMYKVVGDTESVFKVVITMIQSQGLTGIIIDRLPNSGQLVVSATKSNHDYIDGLIKQFQTPAIITESIDLNHVTPSSLLADLEIFYPSDMSEEGGEESQLKFLEDSINDRLIVRGPPQDVEGVLELIKKLDVPLRRSTGPRSRVRILPMSERQAEDALRSIPDLFSVTGRANKIDMVLPQDRRRENRFLRTPNPDRNSIPDNNQGKGNDNSDRGDQDKGGSKQNDSNKRNDGASNSASGANLPKKLNNGDSDQSSFQSFGEETYFVSTSVSAPQETGKQETGKQDNEKKDDAKQEPKSVPGAPIKIKMTPLGLMLSSEDLDALDDMEDIIREFFDMESSGEPETKFFLLEHRDPQKALVQLENLILGPDANSGGGGGGNPLGNLMGNVAQNALGMNPLDLLGGGGLDEGVGILPMVGDVVLHADTRLKGLWVKAVPEDLDLIAEVIDIIDREQPYHMVNPLGKTRRIVIKHRDPAEVEQLIRNQMSKLLEQAGGGAQGGQNPQQLQQQMQQQMMRQMQQLMGGGRGRGGGGNQVEDETPKATLGVDPDGKALLVTGADFIADLIEELVTIVDVKIVEPETYMAIVEFKGKINPDVVGRALKGMLGDKVETNAGEGGTTTSPGRTGQPGQTRGGSSATQAARAQQMQQQAMQQAMMRAMQQRSNRGGSSRTGGSGRGGSSRGGGGSGGSRGNRGGR